MIRFLAFMMLALAACSPRSGAVVSPQTGVTGQYSRQIVISDHPHHVLMGHVIETRRDDIVVHALVIGHRHDGVNRVVMREAYAGGIALPFQPTHRRLDGCTHGHCRDRAVGMIFLSPALLDQARQHGLRARLIGSGDAIDISVPALLFQLDEPRALQ